MVKITKARMIEWFKRNFTFPAVVTLVTLAIGGTVYLQLQGEAIIQMQAGILALRADVDALKSASLSMNLTGSTAMKEHVVVSARDIAALTQRIKDVETYNSSINVILTRLGYMENSLNKLESSLNELKRRQ